MAGVIFKNYVGQMTILHLDDGQGSELSQRSEIGQHRRVSERDRRSKCLEELRF